MRTRSSSNLPGESSPNPTSLNPKRRNRRRLKQPLILEESPIDTMTDQRTIAELLCAPTEGFAEAIVVPPILVDQFEHKHRAAHRWLEKEPLRSILTGEDLVSKFINEFFPPSRTINLRNEISNFQQWFDESFHEAWDRYKDLLRACPHHGFTELHQLDNFYNSLNLADQDSLNSPAGGNLLERRTQDVLTIIENKSKCLAADGNTFLELQDNIQGYVSAFVVNYNQGNSGYRPQAITTRSGIVLNGPSVPMPLPFINPEEDERVEETLTDQDLIEYTIKKMVKALFSNKEKLLELANTPLNENCSAVILKKLPEKLRDPGKFLISCGFSELSLPELISTRMTLELANQAICTPAGIARDVFVPVGMFTFPANFVIVNYESDPRVPLILGRPFLRTARALIDVHGEEMILHLFATNHQSGNPNFSSHFDLTSPEVKNDIFDLEGDMILIEKLINLDSTKDLPPPHKINPLSGSTTSSSPNHLLKEFADELTLITFPSRNDDLPFDIGSDLKEIEYLLNHDPIKEIDSILEDSVDEDNLANLVNTMPEMFTDEHTLDYSSLPLYDEYDDDLFEVESNTQYVYYDLFDSKGEKIKESKLLIDELDIPRSCDFLPSPEYDSFLFEDFSIVDALPSPNKEDKVFNPGILIPENLFEVTTHVALDKNAKKIFISHASLILKDFDPPPLYELPFHKEVPGSKTLLSFSSENKEKVFKPGILTSKGVHISILIELSHQGSKAFKII
nr:reverse transcriptase domain-containing protein [Tanacetum cinerariifolium]